ncbi:MAG TPA: hypothetical protein VIS51_04320 [Solirubrobacterales bacterium]
MKSDREHLSTDDAYTLKINAEAAEQDAYELFQRSPTVENWLAHEAAKTVRERAHGYYLGRLIAEQEALAAP